MGDPKLIPFKQIRQINLLDLLKDRELQRDINYTLTFATRDRGSVDESHPFNPTPVVVIDRPDERSWNHSTFRINDNYHIYFFGNGYPTRNYTEYLRQEDVIFSGFQVKFTKPLERVKVAGRLPMRYNSVKAQWERSGTGIYLPSEKY